MSIESGPVTHRSRPVCDLCGWVGDWRTSRESHAVAVRLAQGQLNFHTELCHSGAVS